MNHAQRARYFTHLWPAACRAQGWKAKDDAQRNLCTMEATSKRSTTELNEDEITALFAYLGFLAGNAQATEKWRRIGRVGAAAVNMQAQGEHHRDQIGYTEGGKLDFDRFRKFGDDGIAPEMNEEEARQYRMTMQNRARKYTLKKNSGPVARASSPAPLVVPTGEDENEPF